MSNPRIWIWDVTRDEYIRIKRDLNLEIDIAQFQERLPDRYNRVILRAREDKGMGIFSTEYQIEAVSGSNGSDKITIELFPPAKPV